MNYEEFYKKGEAKVVSFNVYTSKFKKLVAGVADHICYKCSSREEYEAIRLMLEEQGASFWQSYISGRRIAVVQLPNEFCTHWGPIRYLELADQKPDLSQESGWDHIEIMASNYTEAIKRVEELGEEVQEKVRPHHTTHQIVLPNKFRFVFTREMLIDKIRNEEIILG